MDAVRAPNVARQPPELLQVLDRPAAEEALAVLLLLNRFGQVRVQPQVELARQRRRLGHQPLRHGEGRAGRDGDLRPGAGPLLVERVQALRVGQHRVHVLDKAVGREPSIGLAYVHGAARGDDADAQLARGLDLGLHQAGAPGREDVVVVEDGRAAAEHELREAGAGRRVLGVGVDTPPERVEGLQPREEVGLLRAGAGERLVEVVVRVDEPGRDQRSGEVFEVLGEGRRPVSDLDHESVLGQDPRAVDLGARVVHGHDVGVRKQRPHGP